jgi:nitric oxide reductase activation protein
MGFDENLFRYFHLKWSALRARTASTKEGGVALEGMQRRLERVGGALVGMPLAVGTRDAQERSLRDLLLLPHRIQLFEKASQNENLFWFHLLVHYGADALRLYSQLDTGASLRSRVSEGLAALPQITGFLAADLPRFGILRKQMTEQFDGMPIRVRHLWTCCEEGALIHPGISEELLNYLPELPLNQLRVGAAQSDSLDYFHTAVRAKGSEVKVKTAARPRVIKPPREKDNPLVHVFEKVLTADNFQGGAKSLDGSDESAEHAEALSELTLDSIIRTGQDTETFVKSNAVIETSIQVEAVEPIAAQHLYPEWFYREGEYRQDWCALREFIHPPSQALSANAFENYSQAEALRQRLALVLNESLWRTRQKEGPEIDIDAVVNWWSQKTASGYQDQRIFCARRRMERDVALLVLLDGSLSTDSWVANRRILDQISQATGMLSHALVDFTEKIAFASFSSESRLRCSFGWLKGFEEPWESLRTRLAGMQPKGYTRLGVALRHATSRLLAVPARRRALLVLTDARPTDYDQYEGEHGNQDIRKAVQEALQSEVRFHAIVFSGQIDGSFNTLFGSNRYQVVQTASQISNAYLDCFIDTLR